MKLLQTLACAATLALMISACSQTSNGGSGTTASTPATSCTQNVSGAWVDQNGNACAGGTSVTCPANGQYYSNGQYYTCTPGQPYYPNNTGYPYQSNPAAGSGCSSYLQEYGVPYVPMYWGGSLVCVNLNYLTSTMQQQAPVYYQTVYMQSPYYQDPNYYYSYPPYGGSGSGCDSSFAFSYGGVSAALCM